MLRASARPSLIEEGVEAVRKRPWGIAYLALTPSMTVHGSNTAFALCEILPRIVGKKSRYYALGTTFWGGLKSTFLRQTALLATRKQDMLQSDEDRDCRRWELRPVLYPLV